MPLFLTRSIFFGRGLVSLPGADEAGILAEDSHVAEALLERALTLARKLSLDYVEMRHNQNIFPNVYADTSRATFYLNLPRSAEDLWRSLRPEKRNMVRKAQRNDLAFYIVPPSKIPSFLPLFSGINSLNKQHLGSPAWGVNFFLSIYHRFPRQFRLFLVRYKDKVIGGAIGLSFNGRLAVPVAGSLPQYFHLAPNDLLYWGILEFACRSGYSLFDFGRSPWDSGTFHFKRRWGATVVSLYYHKWFIKKTPSQSVDSLKRSPFLQIISNIWKKCPYTIVQAVGPRLAKHFL